MTDEARHRSRINRILGTEYGKRSARDHTLMNRQIVIWEAERTDGPKLPLTRDEAIELQEWLRQHAALKRAEAFDDFKPRDNGREICFREADRAVIMRQRLLELLNLLDAQADATAASQPSRHLN